MNQEKSNEIFKSGNVIICVGIDGYAKTYQIQPTLSVKLEALVCLRVAIKMQLVDSKKK